MSTARTNIAWTDRTWNPVRGCSRVSEGCRNCYAERVAARLAVPQRKDGAWKETPGPFAGFATSKGWTGRVELVESALLAPLSWRKPARVFVNSMSDLFHEALHDEVIDHVFAVMALAPRHTFQILTKRPERMRRYFAERVPHWSDDVPQDREWHVNEAAIRIAEGKLGLFDWPLPNVWLGVSVEDQETADERIPLLLQTPAAVRFVSAEPLLGPVNLSQVCDRGPDGDTVYFPFVGSGICEGMNEPMPVVGGGPVSWVIVGGESGPGARPCDVAWIRSIVRQCKDARVACFVKQLGARPECHAGDCGWPVPLVRLRGGPNARPALRDHKGADPAEWPEDLRVREFPEVRA